MTIENDDHLKPQPDQGTMRRQALAADPSVSAWVSANAGSGKTYVLSTRVIRLLLNNVEPSKILCLTYTKTAAAEMKNRVFARLGSWVTMADEKLFQELKDITDKSPKEAEIRFARTLFAKALETPGGLKIQTIHAFCEALLHRFPLEANIAGHFELIDELAADFLVSEARRQLLTGKNDESRASIERILQRFGEAGLEKLLGEIVNNRQKLDNLIQALGDQSEWRNYYYKACGLEDGITVQELEKQTWPIAGLTQSYCQEVLAVLPKQGTTTARGYLEKLAAYYDGSEKPPLFTDLMSLFFTQKLEPKSTKNLGSKNALSVTPDIVERFLEACNHVDTILKKINLIEEIDNTFDALTIADRLLALYTKLKNRRGLLDFDDLIQRTELMLSKENVAAWVQYKLDQGIDHILVDEAQDTSPAQWRVIRILANEFFDGQSAGSDTRTIFAVGDEKQSIYSFQGADPKEFDAARSHFSVKIKRAGRAFEPVPLDASFRSTQDVLSAVDHVFSHTDHKRGLAVGDKDVQKHASLREKQAGSVEVWDYERAKQKQEEEDWRIPYDHADQPAVIVANRIADQIKNWIDTSACLEASGKPIKAGDVLVLVRKRDAFVHALSRALKERHIAVAGADRLTMTSHIAILDLLALGRVMLNREDDLSLAALLRSPLFGWSDEALFDLAHGRGDQSLYSALAADIGNNSASADAFTRLERWKTHALNRPVFEFYNLILVDDGARQQLMARLGSETGEMLDEFLNYALAQERTGPVSLETFLNTLENFAPEIKREMEAAGDQVRIMTVHGAKGLEAPIVFLIDPGSAVYHSSSAPLLMPVELSLGLETPLESVLWANSSKSSSSISETITEQMKIRAEEEYRRLLYVGMTRAADKLIVAGYASQTGGKQDNWLSMVWKALEPHARPIDEDENRRLFYPAQQNIDAHRPRFDGESDARADFIVPACFNAPAPNEPPAMRPLVPSGATGLSVEPDRQDTDAEGAASLLAPVQDVQTTYTMAPNLAVKRGIVIHTLLQMLPDIIVADRTERARAYCRYSEPRWTDDDINMICVQVFGLIDNPDYAAFFSENAKSEVSVMGTVMLGDEPRAVSGVIDRISVVGDTVYIIDYKTNANPPQKLSDIPDVYRRQMALYHALVAPLYPDKRVKAALIFTATPQIIEIDEAAMRAALNSMTPNTVM